jgi:PAS domain S-box-containing protein
MTYQSGGVVRSDNRQVPFLPRGRSRGSVKVRTNHWSLRYGIAVVAVVWSTASMLHIPAVGRSGATIPFFAILISAWFGGLGPGVFTIAVGVVLYLIALINRGSSFPTWQVLQIAIFVAGGAMIVVLVEVLHAARRRAEANERWLSAVLSSIGDAVIATDGQGRVSFTNAVARSMTGWAEDEAKGKPLGDVFAIVSEEDHRPVEPPVARVIREGVVAGLANHIAVIARDGTERPITDSAAPIKDDEDNIVGAVLVFRDVTDARRHEKERESLLAAEKAARSEAELANRAKDRFLAVLSHELRTPLTPILIAASSLLEKGNRSLDPSVRSVLEMVQRNVELESRLIDDLLDVSRIARGQMVLDLKTVDVHQAIRDSVEICLDATTVAGLDVVLDLAARHHHVNSDHSRLMQVVWNLVRNAARFSPGGGTLSIRTSSTPGPGPGDEQSNGAFGPGPAQRLIVEFIDTGIGIDPASYDRIFEPFYQGEADGRGRPDGLGLGLTISRTIAEAHGGRLSVQSPGLGKGSTFRLELGTVLVDATPSPEPIKPPSSLPEPSGLNVLLVEDNEDTLRFLTWILRKRNYNVVPVDRVSAALAAAGEAQFDLLISDIELPDGTGLELIHGLGGGRTLPGIAISGFGSDEDRRQSACAGFAEHLTKPIDLNRLEAAIRRVAHPVSAGRGLGNPISADGGPR